MNENNTIPTLRTARLSLTAFEASDAPALAAILAQPDVTKNITADGSSPERCLASAKKRIGWHNASWTGHGYGVWAVRSAKTEIAPPGSLVGWCGFAEPDIGDDPEILYGLAPEVWGHGLATEAAGAAIDWLFSNTQHGGVSAIIFHRLNAASIHIVEKLGLRLCGTMALSDFYSSDALAQDVLNYEIWRLSQGPSRDPARLIFEAPYRIGQLTTLGIETGHDIVARLQTAARARHDLSEQINTDMDAQIADAFALGVSETYLNWYHMPRPS